MKRFFASTLAAALCLLLAACTQPAPTAPSGSDSVSPASPSSSQAALPIPGITADNYPRVDGSTANLPLMAQVYSAVCGVPLTEAETMVQASKTGPAWKKLSNQETDLLLVYEPSQGVQEELETTGTELEITPIGRDALVFIANKANKVESLTQQQLTDIYTGKITDWSAVGGEAGPIAAFQRDADSGSQTLFLKLLMQNTQPMEAPSELRPGMMGSLIDGISEYDGSGGAIGYSVFYYASEMYAKDNLKLLGVDGIQPSAQTIGDGSYPLTNEFYVVIRKDAPTDSPARLLRDWLLTEAGKQTLVDAGYVGVQ